MAARAPRLPEEPSQATPPPAVRGHAYHGELARRALGVAAQPRLAGVPFPIVHAALGVAACAVAVALRPGAVGLRPAVIGVASLCTATAALLAAYDRLVYPAPVRPPAEEVVLPVAALGAFSVVLAGTESLSVRLVAAAVTVAVWGGLPHVGGMAATGREGWWLRFLRDAVSIAVLVPVMLAATSPALPFALRAGVVMVGVLLVTLDGLRSDALRRRAALALATLAGVLVSAVMVAAVRMAVSPGAAAAVALVVSYGARGVAGSVAVRPRRLRAALEHLAVVGLGLAGVWWMTR
jgi:hypothetical protein